MGKRVRWAAALVAGGILILPVRGVRARPPKTLPPLPGREEWIQSRGPAGSVISHPKGFKALFGPRGRVRVLGDRGRLNAATPYVLVQPVIPLRGETALAWLQRSLLPGFLSLPWARVAKRREWDPGRGRIVLDYSVENVRRRALLYCALRAGAGMSYVLSAPAKGFDLARPVLARIAESLRYGRGEPAPPEVEAPAPSSAFRTWTDPREGAFHLALPLRWKAEGGLVKRGPLDFTPTARLTSPGGKVEVYFQDRRSAYFVEPDPELLATGFQEGRWYFSSWGGSLQVLAYRPGAAFPRTYLFAPPFAPKGFRLLRQETLPGPAKKLARLLPGGLRPDRRVDAGFLLYTCKQKKELRTGFLFCATLRLAPKMRRRIWRPLLLAGWRAAPGTESLADRVLQEVLRSFRMDPAWVSAQPGLGRAEGTSLEKVCAATATWLHKTLPDRLSAFRKTLAPPAVPPSSAGPAAPPAWRPAQGRNYYWAPPLTPDPPDL
ncbi:MAG TPA: hypothetical protein ENJ97_01840, partial [Planctomycetes bacterium]|nr:hypothetical protein [Planctomycetota bacterium]